MSQRWAFNSSQLAWTGASWLHWAKYYNSFDHLQLSRYQHLLSSRSSSLHRVSITFSQLGEYPAPGLRLEI